MRKYQWRSTFGDDCGQVPGFLYQTIECVVGIGERRRGTAHIVEYQMTMCGAFHRSRQLVAASTIGIAIREPCALSFQALIASAS